MVKVINDPRVQGASVTGSVRSGSAVASEAGKVIKKTVMELGGSDAFIVCEDADIPKAVAAGIKGRFTNAGQICPWRPSALSSSRRSPINSSASLWTWLKSIRVGDPTKTVTQMGPMARVDLRDSLP